MEVLMRRPEAAAYLQMSRAFLDRAAMTGDGPAMIKLGRKSVRYRREGLDAWIAGRQVRSTSEIRQ